MLGPGTPGLLDEAHDLGTQGDEAVALGVECLGRGWLARGGLNVEVHAVARPLGAYGVVEEQPRELAARVKAVLRRSGSTVTAAASRDAFTVNTSKRTITFYGTGLELSKYEFDILRHFIERRGHVFSREQLMDLVWEQPETSLARTVDAHIKNIRAKLRAVRPDIPIVLISGYIGPLLEQQARAAGIDEILTKPLDLRDLAGAMSKALRQSVEPAS